MPAVVAPIDRGWRFSRHGQQHRLDGAALRAHGTGLGYVGRRLCREGSIVHQCGDYVNLRLAKKTGVRFNKYQSDQFGRPIDRCAGAIYQASRRGRDGEVMRLV